MDWKIEVIVVPVTDVERARAFYADGLGFTVDVDQRISDTMRVLQMTPPGSGCSLTIGQGLSPMAPGALQGIQFVVADIHAALQVIERVGAENSGITHFEGSERLPGPGGPWNSFLSFSDPDGNGFTIQERPAAPTPADGTS